MKRKINESAYLEYAQDFSVKENQILEQFRLWLPQFIIDCHAHCSLETHLHRIDDSEYYRTISTFPSFSLKESEKWHSILYPGKTVRTLRFPIILRDIDFKASNVYLLEESDCQDRVAIYGLPDELQYTAKMLDDPRVAALKMYYSYFKPPSSQIYQYFPKEILETAQAKDIPIILHPPTLITECFDQILKLVMDFPRLRICIAHLGLIDRAMMGMTEVYSRLAGHSSIIMDTSMITSKEVVSASIDAFGMERIMYGSDQPLNLIRATPYRNPHFQQRMRYATSYPYHWVNLAEQAQFRELAAKSTLIHWQSLLAIKEAIDMLPKEILEKAKNRIFYENAKEFYSFPWYP